MSPPTPTLAPPQPFPRKAADPFERACARRDYVSLQDHLAELSKRDACDRLSALFPHLSRHWIVRHFADLMAMDPDAFWHLTYSDPTGNEACRRVMEVGR